MTSKQVAAREHWRAVIASQEASGLGVAEFCRRDAVPRTQLFSWRRRLREEAARGPETAAFVEVRRAAPSASQAPELELALGGGRSVRVRRGFDAELLRELARALEPLA